MKTLRELELAAITEALNEPDVYGDLDRMYITPGYTQALYRLVVKECAAWMEDGNIPDGFYEADRMLKHFGVEE